MGMDYYDLVNQIIVDGLKSLKGDYVCGEDLYVYVTEATIDRSILPVWMCTYFDSYCDMQRFAVENWEKCAEFYQDYKDRTGEEIDIFTEADKLIYLMVQDTIYNWMEETVLVESKRNKDFIVTDKVIDNLKEELDLKDVEVSEWLRDDEELETVR